MKIVFATGNKGKLREASEILGEGFELISLPDVGINEDVPETGDTLLANSLQKACTGLYGRDSKWEVKAFEESYIRRNSLS